MRGSLAAILAALLLTSCQSNPSRAGIPSPTGYFSHGYDVTGAGAQEVAQVQQMLRTIAAQTNLPKRSPAPSNYSPVPIALYGDSRVQLLASRHKDYVHVEVIRWQNSGASAFARIDPLVRNTLSRKFGNRLYVEPEPDYSHPIVTE
jgi:hypothetical protein